jgi:exodeoxyribonuclease VII small subunit
VTDLSYEKALELLDQKLRELEDGQLSLDDSLKAVDEARRYLKLCQDRLEAARGRIEVRAETPAGGPAAEQEAEQEEAPF